MKTLARPKRKRDPARWIAAGLVTLALAGIGTMHAHVLMLRRGLDLLPAAAQAGGVILFAAIPIGYLVYRFWFADPRPLLKGAAGTCRTHEANQNENEFLWQESLISWRQGPAGWGLYCGHTRIDDD